MHSIKKRKLPIQMHREKCAASSDHLTTVRLLFAGEKFDLFSIRLRADFNFLSSLSPPRTLFRKHCKGEKMNVRTPKSGLPLSFRKFSFRHSIPVCGWGVRNDEYGMPYRSKTHPIWISDIRWGENLYPNRNDLLFPYHFNFAWLRASRIVKGWRRQIISKI